MNKLIVKKGNIFNEEVDSIVNPWNMNYIPFFLLYSHGVSGQLKKLAGYKPFIELMKYGVMKPGTAVITSGGKLNKKVIHVAGLKWYWISSLEIVEKCTKNALLLAEKNNLSSIAFPLIGAGVGGLNEQVVEKLMIKVITETNTNLNVCLIKYQN